MPTTSLYTNSSDNRPLLATHKRKRVPQKKRKIADVKEFKLRTLSEADFTNSCNYNKLNRDKRWRAAVHY